MQGQHRHNRHHHFRTYPSVNADIPSEGSRTARTPKHRPVSASITSLSSSSSSTLLRHCSKANPIIRPSPRPSTASGKQPHCSTSNSMSTSNTLKKRKIPTIKDSPRWSSIVNTSTNLRRIAKWWKNKRDATKIWPIVRMWGHGGKRIWHRLVRWTWRRVGSSTISATTTRTTSVISPTCVDSGNSLSYLLSINIHYLSLIMEFIILWVFTTWPPHCWPWSATQCWCTA